MADVQAVPTIGDEAAGLVAVEGMASGIPLICTDSGGLTEYCSNGDSIIIDRGKDLPHKLAKAIMCVRDNPTMKAVAKRKRDKVLEEYSRQVYYREYFRIIKA